MTVGKRKRQKLTFTDVISFPPLYNPKAVFYLQFTDEGGKVHTAMKG